MTLPKSCRQVKRWLCRPWAKLGSACKAQAWARRTCSDYEGLAEDIERVDENYHGEAQSEMERIDSVFGRAAKRPFENRDDSRTSQVPAGPLKQNFGAEPACLNGVSLVTLNRF
jgi:hypothetical protein